MKKIDDNGGALLSAQESIVRPLTGKGRRFAVRVWLFLLQSFFILMLVVPTIFQVPRGVFLVLITGVGGFLSLRVWRVHCDITLLWLLTISVGLFGVFWGVVNSAPGAFNVASVFVVWPALYFLFIGLVHKLGVIKSIESALLVGIALATVMALSVMLAGLTGYIDAIYGLLEFQGAAFGNHGGFIEFRTYGLTTVMYGFPFVISYILVRREELHGFSKFGIYLLLVAIFIALLGSGRRAFWLVMLLTPFIIIPVLQYSACYLKSLSLILLIFKSSVLAFVIVASLIGVIGIDPLAIVDNFVSAFQGQEESSSARYLQAAALWEAFTNSPLIGHGLGSTVDVVRSHEMPWAFELSYLALLMQVGLVGVSIYAGAILWIIFKGIHLSRKDPRFAKLFVPLVTALCAFLIMNATNPYLSKFDYVWVIFLPVALINAHLTQRAKND